MAAKLSVRLRKSPIGFSKDQKQTVTALGLRKRQQVVEHDDTPAVRGMIRKVSHLVDVEAASQSVEATSQSVEAASQPGQETSPSAE